MNADVERALREDLSRQAESILASDELRQAILERMAPERAARVRADGWRGLVAAAAVVALAIGAYVVSGDSGSEPPQPAPPVPSVDHNGELLDRLPVGEEPRVLVRDSTSTVTSPDGATFSIGVERTLLGRSDDRVLTFDYAGLAAVPSDGPAEKLSGPPDRGLYAVSPDGTTFYRNGVLVDLTTMRETGTMAVPDIPVRDYTADWTAAGIVFSSSTSVVLVSSKGAPVSVPALLPPASGQFAIGSNRVLVTPGSGCPYIAELQPDGKLSTVLERCERDLISLSRDGSTGLLGEPNSSAAPPHVGSVTGLLDVETGGVTELPWLTGLDEFPADGSWGDDLFSYTWEDGDTVLLAYYVARDNTDPRSGTVRVVRCTLASEMCEVAPGSVQPLLFTATIFSRGIGE